MITKFLSLIDEMETYLEQFKFYFQGKLEAEQLLKLQTESAYFYDRATNTYVASDNADPDDIFRQIEYEQNMGVTTEVRKEEILPTLKEGSITKRKDGRWQGRYYDNGYRKYLYASTKKEIIEKMNKAIVERNKSDKEKIATKDIKLGKWLSQWLILYKEEDVKESTLITYKRVLSHVYNHSISKKRVGLITSIDIERFLKSIKAKRTREMVFGLLKTCFKDLERNRVINQNVFHYIDNNYTTTKKEKYIPTEKELSIFLDLLKPLNKELYYLAKFISMTGLRKGEAVALHWSDIKNDKIYVTKAYDLISHKVTTPKSKTSIRNVPLVPGVTKLLSDISKNSNEIFYSINKGSASALFNYHANKLGFKHLTLHGLRHYFATQCLQANIDKKLVQVWLGHSNYETTANLYTHIKPDFETAESIKLAKYWEDKE